MKISILLFSLVLPLVVHANSSIRSQAPECLANGQALTVNNSQALHWKESTANQFHARAHVSGPLIKLYADHSGHNHLEIEIGPNLADSIEIIYNEEFGTIPGIGPGTSVEACGDYITSNAPSGHYPASPDGALIHWVHRSDNPNHESGFLVINGEVYGQGQ